ncbi:MAG TPA: SPW repeat protein [Chloroflexota bacterium]|nr:SPW repeat protein [Chloroflexota bacterium]
MQVSRSQIGQIKLANGLNALAGIWVFFAPFLLGYSLVAPATINDVIVGFIVAVFSGLRFFGAFGAVWLSLINAALGVWLILSPFILGYQGVPLVNDVILGFIIAILGTWSTLVSQGGLYGA